MLNAGDSPCDWISLIQRGLTAETGANNTGIKPTLRSCPARRWLTSTMPWLMLPYCLLLSITRLMTMMVAMATAMTSRPMRALLLRLKSSRSGPTDSCSNRTDRPQGVRGDKPTGAPGPCCPSNHPGGGGPHPFPPGTNPGLLLCRLILYHLSNKRSPRILEWVAYPFSSRSS